MLRQLSDLIMHFNLFNVSCYLMVMVNRIIYGLRRKKTGRRGLASNKGSGQPAHPLSLISAFVIRLLKSIISRLATFGISIFFLVSITEQAGFSLILSETPKAGPR